MMGPVGVYVQAAAAVVSGTAFADFVNGVYTVNGVGVTAADVVSDTGRISGSGLSITATDVSLLGDFLDTLLPANFAAVFEWTGVANQFGGHRVFLLALAAVDGSEISVYTGFRFPVLYENDPFGDGDRQADGPDQAIIGTNKMAMTRVDDRLSGSLNGGAVFTIATPISPPPSYNSATFAFHNGGTDPSGYIRKIDVFAPVDDAALPALSA